MNCEIGQFLERKNKKPKILIFQDDEIMQTFYEQKFEKDGFLVKSFIDYENVVENVVLESPDIIMVDILVSTPIDGWEAIKLLKADKRTKDIPIFVVDNLADAEAVAKSKRLGAVAHLCLANYLPAELAIIFKKYLVKIGRFTKEELGLKI